MSNHDILIIARENHFLLRCNCGVYTTTRFNELRHAIRNLAERHGVRPGQHPTRGPFTEFIISEQP